nr:uncharacterized protein LOC101937683 isoform X3 [Chrysemys picta bellii]
MTFPARSALTRLLFCCAERRCVAERSGALEDTGRDLCRSRMRHSTHERTGAVRDRCHFPPFSPLLHACFWIHHQRRDWTLFYRNTLYAFVEGNPVRHAVMEKISQEVGSQLKTLKSLSNTRWACRAEAVAAVKQNYSIILQALQEIIETTRLADPKIKARGLIHELNSFKFIFALHMMHPILQIVVKVSKALQAPDLNLLTAMTGEKLA